MATLASSGVARPPAVLINCRLMVPEMSQKPGPAQGFAASMVIDDRVKVVDEDLFTIGERGVLHPHVVSAGAYYGEKEVIPMGVRKIDAVRLQLDPAIHAHSGTIKECSDKH